MKEFSTEVLTYFDSHLDSDLSTLALKPSPFSNFDRRELMTQLQGLQIAKKKFPFFTHYPQLKYPPKISLEQSSSEACARFKEVLTSGEKIVDLTGGFGVDTFWMGKEFESIYYVEPQEHLQSLAKRNFPLLGLPQVKYYHKTAEDFLIDFNEKVDWVYLDPSRRKADQRKIDLKGYEPNVVELQDQLLNIGENVLIKLSPMQDITDLIRQLKNVCTIYLCEWDRELKELLVVLNSTCQSSEAEIEVVNLVDIAASYREKHTAKSRQAEYGSIDKYIFEPGPGLQKSGLADAFGLKNNLKKIQKHSQLFTSATPFFHHLGKSFEVIKNTSLKKENVLPNLEKEMANVIVRNFPIKAAELKKKLGIKEGGTQYLIATTDIDNSPRLLICQRITTE